MPVPAASSDSFTATAAASGESARELPRPPRHVLIALLVVAAGWWMALVWLAATTANPVTFNRQQLAQSHVVVTAEITDQAQGRARVIQHWYGLGVPEEITVRDLDQLSVQDGRAFILPLTVEGPATFHVTRAQLVIVGPDGEPLRAPAYVYPASAEAESQLAQILAEVADRR